MSRCRVRFKFDAQPQDVVSRIKMSCQVQVQCSRCVRFNAQDAVYGITSQELHPKNSSSYILHFQKLIKFKYVF